MAHSMTFDGNDLSDYELIVTSPGASLYGQIVSHVQLQERGYAFRPQREPRRIRVAFDVTGNSRSDLDSNLDNIRRIVTQLTVKELKFDSLSGRYYNAIFERLQGNYRQAAKFSGSMSFICPDPVAFSTTEMDKDHDVNDDPKTLYEPKDSDEVVGGSAFLLPVYTFEAGADLSAITLIIKNETTVEELQIADLTLDNGKKLVIDCSLWLVTNDGTAEMANVTGKFPRLQSNLRNQFTITNFGSLGTLNITYREAYL